MVGRRIAVIILVLLLLPLAHAYGVERVWVDWRGEEVKSISPNATLPQAVIKVRLTNDMADCFPGGKLAESTCSVNLKAAALSTIPSERTFLNDTRLQVKSCQNTTGAIICSSAPFTFSTKNAANSVSYSLRTGSTMTAWYSSNVPITIDTTHPKAVQLDIGHCDEERCYASAVRPTPYTVSFEDPQTSFAFRQVFIGSGSTSSRVANCTGKTCIGEVKVPCLHEGDKQTIGITSVSGVTSREDAQNPVTTMEREVICTSESPKFLEPFTLEPGGTLGVPVSGGSLTYRAKVKVPYGEPKAVLLASKINGVDELRAVCEQAEADGTLWSCTWNVDGLKAGKHDVQFVVTDAVGNNDKHTVKTKLTILNITMPKTTGGKTPAVDKFTSKVTAAPAPLNRLALDLAAANYKPYPAYVTYELQPKSSGAKVVRQKLDKCWYKLGNETNYSAQTTFFSRDAKESRVLYPTQDSSKPNRLNLQVRADRDLMAKADVFDVKCQLALVVTENDRNVYGVEELENLSFEITLRESPLGQPGAKFVEKIQKEEKALNGSSMKFLTTLRKVRATMDGICTTVEGMAAMGSSGSGMELLGNALRSTVVGAGAGQGLIQSGFSIFRIGDGLGNSLWVDTDTGQERILRKVCKQVNCRNIVTEDGKRLSDNAIAWNDNAEGDVIREEQWKQSTGEKTGEKAAPITEQDALDNLGGQRAIGFATNDPKDHYDEYGALKKDLTSNMRAPNFENSMVQSIRYGCIGGIIHNAGKWQDINCGYLECLKTQSASGNSVAVCDQAKSYKVCTQLTGELFELPYVNMVTNVARNVDNMVQNMPAYLLKYTTTGVCRGNENKAANDPVTLGCHLQKAYLTVVDYNKQTTQMFNGPMKDDAVCLDALCNGDKCKRSYNALPFTEQTSALGIEAWMANKQAASGGKNSQDMSREEMNRDFGKTQAAKTTTTGSAATAPTQAYAPVQGTQGKYDIYIIQVGESTGTFYQVRVFQDGRSLHGFTLRETISSGQEDEVTALLKTKGINKPPYTSDCRKGVHLKMDMALPELSSPPWSENDLDEKYGPDVDVSTPEGRAFIANMRAGTLLGNNLVEPRTCREFGLSQSELAQLQLTNEQKAVEKSGYLCLFGTPPIGIGLKGRGVVLPTCLDVKLTPSQETTLKTILKGKGYDVPQRKPSESTDGVHRQFLLHSQSSVALPQHSGYSVYVVVINDPPIPPSDGNLVARVIDGYDYPDALEGIESVPQGGDLLTGNAVTDPRPAGFLGQRLYYGVDTDGMNDEFLFFYPDDLPAKSKSPVKIELKGGGWAWESHLQAYFTQDGSHLSDMPSDLDEVYPLKYAVWDHLLMDRGVEDVQTSLKTRGYRAELTYAKNMDTNKWRYTAVCPKKENGAYRKMYLVSQKVGDSEKYYLTFENLQGPLIPAGGMPKERFDALYAATKTGEQKTVNANVLYSVDPIRMWKALSTSDAIADVCSNAHCYLVLRDRSYPVELTPQSDPIPCNGVLSGSGSSPSPQTPGTATPPGPYFVSTKKYVVQGVSGLSGEQFLVFNKNQDGTPNFIGYISNVPLPGGPVNLKVSNFFCEMPGDQLRSLTSIQGMVAHSVRPSSCAQAGAPASPTGDSKPKPKDPTYHVSAKKHTVADASPAGDYHVVAQCDAAKQNCKAAYYAKDAAPLESSTQSGNLAVKDGKGQPLPRDDYTVVQDPVHKIDQEHNRGNVRPAPGFEKPSGGTPAATAPVAGSQATRAADGSSSVSLSDVYFLTTDNYEISSSGVSACTGKVLLRKNGEKYTVVGFTDPGLSPLGVKTTVSASGLGILSGVNTIEIGAVQNRQYVANSCFDGGIPGGFSIRPSDGDAACKRDHYACADALSISNRDFADAVNRAPGVAGAAGSTNPVPDAVVMNSEGTWVYVDKDGNEIGELDKDKADKYNEFFERNDMDLAMRYDKDAMKSVNDAYQHGIILRTPGEVKNYNAITSVFGYGTVNDAAYTSSLMARNENCRKRDWTTASCQAVRSELAAKGFASTKDGKYYKAGTEVTTPVKDCDTTKPGLCADGKHFVKDGKVYDAKEMSADEIKKGRAAVANEKFYEAFDRWAPLLIQYAQQQGWLDFMATSGLGDWGEEVSDASSNYISPEGWKKNICNEMVVDIKDNDDGIIFATKTDDLAPVGTFAAEVSEFENETHKGYLYVYTIYVTNPVPMDPKAKRNDYKLDALFRDCDGCKDADLINGTFNLTSGASFAKGDGPRRGILVLPNKYKRLCITFDQPFPDSMGRSSYCREIKDRVFDTGSPYNGRASTSTSSTSSSSPATEGWGDGSMAGEI